MIRRVVVGISGGVDSAVAALLIKQKGFNVHGVFMKNWDLIDEQGTCPGEADLADAEWVCRRLAIPLTVVNFVKEYWNNVFGVFLQDYEAGITPNPDILCNKHIKFDAFYRHCTEHLGADAIATGHYACSSFGSFLEHAQDGKNARLLCAADKHKDQTFFLSQMPQHALQRTMFPLGPLHKHNDVRRLATDAGLDRVARKRDSTGICFVGKRNFTEFIGDYIRDRPGAFQSHDTGAVLGEHSGFHHWTVGQRSRLEGNAKPLFVQRKCSETNVIFVVPGTDHPSLYTDWMYAGAPSWIDANPFDGDDAVVMECEFRFQHTKPLVGCTVVQTNAKGRPGVMIRLQQPLRAITPGQFAVFYRGNECLGSARIEIPGPSMEWYNGRSLNGESS